MLVLTTWPDHPERPNESVVPRSSSPMSLRQYKDISEQVRSQLVQRGAVGPSTVIEDGAV
jgi:hypothetical protein